MIKALVFDFDGLILETEGPIYQSWLELFEAQSCELSFELWASIIGVSLRDHNPFDDLEKQLGHPVDRVKLNAIRRERELALLSNMAPLPGVVDYLESARDKGLKLAVASSSSRAWVVGHLETLGLLHYFDTVQTSTEVHNTKPFPDLYQAAILALKLQPTQAVALEDSPSGILSARRAGLFCVAVPNDLTRRMDLSKAHLRLDSLSQVPLDVLLEKIEALSP
jgi:HAD superfamily hydrolase (TIGR01509 family)